jgi:hypothetical protein
LDELGSEAAIPGLLQALEHPKSYVRISAVEALGKISGMAAISGLRQALEDQDSYIRRSAAQALGKIGGESLFNDLWQLNLRRPEDHLMDVISAIQDRCRFYNYEIWQESVAIQNAKLEVQKSNQVDASGQAINQFPNAREVKIFERVEHYHEHPSGSNP